jgi:hypothetical protein
LAYLIDFLRITDRAVLANLSEGWLAIRAKYLDGCAASEFRSFVGFGLQEMAWRRISRG